MPLYVKNEAVAEMAGRLASLKGISKTDVLKQLLSREMAAMGAQPSRVDQALAIGERLRADGGPGGLPADKAFIDSLYEDD